MTLPASIQVNAQFPFPATVRGNGPVTIGKQGGIWTAYLNLVGLSPIQPGFDPTTKYILIYDALSGAWIQGPISTVLAGANLPRIVTAAGVVTVTVSDTAILMNKSVGAATTINLPTAVSRAGLELVVKDYKGDAATNNITVVASGSETLDGFSNAAAQANGTAKIVTNYGAKTFAPLASGGWYLK